MNDMASTAFNDNRFSVMRAIDTMTPGADGTIESHWLLTDNTTAAVYHCADRATINRRVEHILQNESPLHQIRPEHVRYVSWNSGLELAEAYAVLRCNTPEGVLRRHITDEGHVAVCIGIVGIPFLQNTDAITHHIRSLTDHLGWPDVQISTPQPH